MCFNGTGYGRDIGGLDVVGLRHSGSILMLRLICGRLILGRGGGVLSCVFYV